MLAKLQLQEDVEDFVQSCEWRDESHKNTPLATAMQNVVKNGTEIDLNELNKLKEQLTGLVVGDPRKKKNDLGLPLDQAGLQLSQSRLKNMSYSRMKHAVELL